MKKRILLLLAPIIALTLECLPYSVITYFAFNYGSGRIVRTFSYFDFIPFGYADFGPLFAAVLTCVLLFLTIIYVFSAKRGLKIASAVVAMIAGLLSVSPVIIGLDWLSIINVAVTLLLFAEAAMLLIKTKEEGQ